MNLLKQIEQDKRRIIEEARVIKELANKDMKSILIELGKIKAIANVDVKNINSSADGKSLDL